MHTRMHKPKANKPTLVFSLLWEEAGDLKPTQTPVEQVLLHSESTQCQDLNF